MNDVLGPYAHPDDVQFRTSTRTFRPLTTPDEDDELAARRSVHAGILPSNLAHHMVSSGTGYVDDRGRGGGGVAEEQGQRGWTVQQPFVHVDCDVMHLCVLCAAWVDPDYVRQHECAVRKELEH